MSTNAPSRIDKYVVETWLAKGLNNLIIFRSSVPICIVIMSLFEVETTLLLSELKVYPLNPTEPLSEVL